MFNCSCLLYKQHYLFALLVYVGICCGLPGGIATGAKGEGAEHYWGGWVAANILTEQKIPDWQQNVIYGYFLDGRHN